MPSLPPLLGSTIPQVKKDKITPGRPTIIKAACQPLSPKGAIVGSGKALVHNWTIHPPKNKPIPAPR